MRSGITDMLMYQPGISDDGHGCITRVYDLCVDNCERVLRSFSTKSWRGGNVRACKVDRVTWTIDSIDSSRHR